MKQFSRLLHRMPLRITALLLGIVIIVPAVLLFARLFPAMDRETIAVIFAFCLAGYLAFHVFWK